MSKKITVYADLCIHKLEKLKNQIKKARNDGNINKKHIKKLLKEAKSLRNTLKELE